MNKKKYPSELNSTTIRIDIGTYHLLAHLGITQGISIAEALRQILSKQDEKLQTERATPKGSSP